MRRSIVVAPPPRHGQRVRLRWHAGHVVPRSTPPGGRPSGARQGCLFASGRLPLRPHGWRSAASPARATFRRSPRTYANTGVGGESSKSRVGAFP